MPRPARPRKHPVTRSPEVEEKSSKFLANTAEGKSEATVGKTVMMERELIGVTLAQERWHSFPHANTVNVTSIRPEVKNESGTSLSPVSLYWIPIAGLSLGFAVLAVIITVVVIIWARRGAQRTDGDVEKGSSGFPYGGTRSEYKIRIKVKFLNGINLGKVIKLFIIFSRKRESRPRAATSVCWTAPG